MPIRRLIMHPLFIFLSSITAVCAAFILYLYWYLKTLDNVNFLINKFHLDSSILANQSAWVMILTMSILVTCIIAGLIIIFIYYQKVNQLYKAQNNFINSFTHELKTPLASLQLYLDTFKKFDLSPEDKAKFLDFMVKDTFRLSKHVAQILQVANIEARNDKYPLRPHNIKQFIENFLSINAHHFSEGRILLDFIPDKEIQVPLNPPLFEMLMMNLIHNAFKYNDNRPEVTIKVFIKRARLHLQILDNGRGIAPHERKKVFKKFYQIKDSISLNTEGTGLGLFLVKLITKIHKGSIQVGPNPATGGSIFTISFVKWPIW